MLLKQKKPRQNVKTKTQNARYVSQTIAYVAHGTKYIYFVPFFIV